MIFYQLITVLALAMASRAQSPYASASFDGNFLTNTLTASGSMYDGSANYQITRIESTGYGYWVTSSDATIAGAPISGSVTFNANNAYIRPNRFISANETLTVELQGALIDPPQSSGTTTYTTIYTVWFSPVSGGNQVSKPFQGSVTVDWSDWPNASPVLAAEFFSLGKAKKSLVKRSPQQAARYVAAPTTLATVNDEVGVFAAVN